jgi:hypothetical protein
MLAEGLFLINPGIWIRWLCSSDVEMCGLTIKTKRCFSLDSWSLWGFQCQVINMRKVRKFETVPKGMQGSYLDFRLDSWGVDDVHCQRHWGAVCGLEGAHRAVAKPVVGSHVKLLLAAVDNAGQGERNRNPLGH